MQELKARVAPVLARWRNKLLALALEAFHSNAAASCSKRLHVQKALQYWNNRALASAFAQWLDSMQVIDATLALNTNLVTMPKLQCHPGLSGSCSAVQRGEQAKVRRVCILALLVCLLGMLPMLGGQAELSSPNCLQHTFSKLVQHNLAAVSPLPNLTDVSDALQFITVSFWLHAGATAGDGNPAESWTHHVQCEAGCCMARLASGGRPAPLSAGEAGVRPQLVLQQAPHPCMASLEGVYLCIPQLNRNLNAALCIVCCTL